MEFDNDNYIEISFEKELFKNSPYSLKSFLLDRANFQFLKIYQVNDQAGFYISKKRYEFSLKKFKKFGIGHDVISVFWILSEILSTRIYDILLGKKHLIPILTSVMSSL